MNYSCYLCKKKKIAVIRDKVRHSIKRKVLKCDSCGLVFLEPENTSVSNFYNRDYRKLYTPIINKACSSAEIFNIYLPFQNQRIKNYRHLFNKKSRILEIGCSSGYFLYALKKHAKECIGIETNIKDANFAKNKYGLKVFVTPLEKTDLPLRYFDVIFLFETLEHLNDPLYTLKIARNYLKPDGYICIQVPNIDDVLLSVYKIDAYEDFYYRAPHLFYFSRHTLLKLTRKAGFSGNISCYQEYSFINHMYWMLLNKPMDSFTEGVSRSLPIKNKGIKDNIKNNFNNWIDKVDQEYKKLLKKYFLTQSIVFIGKSGKQKVSS